MMTISIRGRKTFPTASIRRFHTSAVRAGEARITWRNQTTWKWSWTTHAISAFTTKSFCPLIKKGLTSTFTNRIKSQVKTWLRFTTTRTISLMPNKSELCRSSCTWRTLKKELFTKRRSSPVDWEELAASEVPQQELQIYRWECPLAEVWKDSLIGRTRSKKIMTPTTLTPSLDTLSPVRLIFKLSWLTNLMMRLIIASRWIRNSLVIDLSQTKRRPSGLSKPKMEDTTTSDTKPMTTWAQTK